MKIGIDCRMSGLKHAGIGRYVENLVDELKKIDSENTYFFVTRSDIPHYSLKEQLILPLILYKEKLDLVHFPHFNVPILYFRKYIVTIHDLIKHTSKGVETTTRSPWVYWLKYFGYKLIFGSAVKRATKIIVPSQAVKTELIKEYHLNFEKIVVTYEGVDSKFKIQNSLTGQAKFKVGVMKPYLLYVGSVYPHKNIERLIEAVKLVNSDRLPVTLVVVCARSVFWERLKTKVKDLEAEKYINLVGFVPDEELGALYKSAEAFVFPSLAEGFGLPGLEAMAAGTPVLASDIPVLREIYRSAAVYFNPLDSTDIAEKIKKIITDKKLRENLKQQGLELVEEYSWQKMASETLSIYNKILHD